MTPAVNAALEQLSHGKRLRRTLPGIGFVYVERPVPFLCVYRKPPDVDDGSTSKLVTGFPSYFLGSADRDHQDGLRAAIVGVASELVRQCGAALVLEVFSRWSGSDPEQPRFCLHAAPDVALDPTIDALAEALGNVKLAGVSAAVEVVREPEPGPLHLPTLNGVSYVGLEIEPIYRSLEGQRPYPPLLGELRRALDIAIRGGAFGFAKELRSAPEHADALGRRTLVKAARDADRQLAGVSESLGYLLLVTPTNTEQAWQEFESSSFERAPHFRYRPLHVDPELLKRKLYDIPLERIEDPTLTLLFREKQEELDRSITMLLDRGTERFLWGSLQVFGGVDSELEVMAREILTQTSSDHAPPSEAGVVDSDAFAELARAEIAYYRGQWPELTAQVLIRDDVPNLMTLNGNLVIQRQMAIGPIRARALIQHEIGTHLVTYYNGTAQRLKHLSSGLAGYEALQEGLAVLAEHLVGGLSRSRLRVIAARVLAVKSVVDGATFVDTFRLLEREVTCGFRSAFNIAMRVHRSGGLTKDAIYLRGLGDVLGHLSNGGELEELLVGKLAIRHVPLIRELRQRQVVTTPRLRPRYLDDPGAHARLARVSNGARVVDLVES
jgi:uncharacterized protein (TIGR02421 family)